MTPDRLLAAPSPLDRLGAAGFLIVLLFILFGGWDRRRTAGSIHLAEPAFIPLEPDGAERVAHDLGTAYAVLIDAERRRERQT